ncbi:MAG: sulfatase-like hydrolase/transferase [Candidatus Sulfotelmatobacter sp.]
MPRAAPRAQEWVDNYEGKFDHGWDKLREEILARQKKLGVVPQNAELTKQPKEIPAWDEVDPKMKPILARHMEVYAGFLEHTDHHVERLIDTLKDLKILDDTLIYVIIGDNGASAEGSLNGTFNESIMLNGITGIEAPEFLTERIDKFGSPEANNHYAVGWAHAMDTPYQWTKQIASHWGGTRNSPVAEHLTILQLVPLWGFGLVERVGHAELPLMTTSGRYTTAARTGPRRTISPSRAQGNSL